VTPAPAPSVEVVRHRSARAMRLSIDPRSGRVRLTLPPRAPLKPALAWVEAQAGWIADQRAQLPQPVPFAPGASFPFRGEPLRIDWQPALPRTPRLVAAGTPSARLCCGGPEAGLAARVTRWLCGEALALLGAETAEFAARAGVSVAGVAIGDPRGRWGSCAASGAIRYSWRLILAPDFVRRATVAHEVAHRTHMNHSPAFHAHLATLNPDGSAARAWLRAHGSALHWIGRAG
jgi:predicted metal-dependent hydrolase